MSATVDPHMLYPQSPFFLDYIEGNLSASQSFSHSVASLRPLAQERAAVPSPQTRADLCDALLNYNRRLDASAPAIANIDQLRSPESLCVIGGQQVEFLGGPLFVIYKIVSIIRTAARLSQHLAVPVIPVFWLASEDHDFAEINHTRWIDDSGTLRTIAFEWDGQGRPIEQLPITYEVQRAYAEARQKIRFLNAADAALFTPEANDDYCTWHARLWSRLFAKYGLVVVEPRVLRPLTHSFFDRALTQQREIRECLTRGAARLEASGYPVPLNAAQSGGLFTITEDGSRLRTDPSPREDSSEASPTYSADAALRPLLADSLFPTIANILGPSELAYHGMLRPLYEQWQIPQPLAIPRQGGTLLSRKDLQQLADFGVNLAEVLDPGFKPADAAKRVASKELLSEFEGARSRMQETLIPLKNALSQVDPGLESRWHQTVDQVKHQVDRLEDRANRADLARRGLSVKSLQNLKPWLLPMEKPQERILSGFSLIATYGVKWIHDMLANGELSGSGAPIRLDDLCRFEHQLIVVEEIHE